MGSISRRMAVLTLVLVSFGCSDDGESRVEDGADAGMEGDVQWEDTSRQEDDTWEEEDSSQEEIEPPDFGDPIEVAEAELEQWVWISMPEMRCSDGSEGGFAVNFTEASDDLVVYLQGGGICYDQVTCAFAGAASSVGDDPIHTALDGPVRSQQGIFDRSNPANPLRDSNFVVVPHCTGDHHTGNKIAEYGTATYHHVGYANITRMLERVVPTFIDAERVVLSGFSAGGVGISANYHQLANAFEFVGQSQPYLMIDSGPFLRPEYLVEEAQQKLRQPWGLDDTIGSFCPRCLTSGFHEMYRVNAELHPGLRASLIATYEDSVVAILYTLLNGSLFSGERMREGLHDLADWLDEQALAMEPGRFEVFYYEGTAHGGLHVNSFYSTPGLLEFVEGQLGEEGWESVRP